MALAIFDLDNTLLAGDSDHAWGEFACEEGLVDAGEYGERNDAFYRDYLAGRLDIEAYVRHALAPLAGRPPELIAGWHRKFMARKIDAMMLPAATELLDRRKGGECAGWRRTCCPDPDAGKVPDHLRFERYDGRVSASCCEHQRLDRRTGRYHDQRLPRTFRNGIPRRRRSHRLAR